MGPGRACYWLQTCWENMIHNHAMTHVATWHSLRSQKATLLIPQTRRYVRHHQRAQVPALALIFTLDLHRVMISGIPGRPSAMTRYGETWVGGHAVLLTHRAWWPLGSPQRIGSGGIKWLWKRAKQFSAGWRSHSWSLWLECRQWSEG